MKPRPAMACTHLRSMRLLSTCWWLVIPHHSVKDANLFLGGGPSTRGLTLEGIFSIRGFVLSPYRYYPPEGDSLYDTLKISPYASQEEIKKAYYKQSLLSHPDMHQGDYEAAENFRIISEAYEVLGNVEKRREYNMKHGFYAEPVEFSIRDDYPRTSYRRRQRIDPTKFNVKAWERAHYGRNAGYSSSMPPDWRRSHGPQYWWREREQDSGASFRSDFFRDREQTSEQPVDAEETEKQNLRRVPLFMGVFALVFVVGGRIFYDFLESGVPSAYNNSRK